MHSAMEKWVRSRPRLWTALGFVAVLAVGAAARLAPWEHSFAPGGVYFAGDGDAYYHALRAERVARDWPRIPWFDAGMDYPYGADIPWPPLFDQLIATVAVATGPPTQDHVATVAALVPPVLGLALIALAAFLGSLLLGGGPWLDASLLLALLPVAVRHSVVGRSDQHVAEALLCTLACCAYAAGFRRTRPGWLWPSLLGLSMALAFWNWAGSAMYLLVLIGHLAFLHLFAPPGDPAVPRSALVLLRGAGIAAILLAVSIAAWGPQGALLRGGLTPITGLSVALSAATAASAALVVAARRRDPAAGGVRRLLHLAGIAVAFLAVLLLPAPSLRAGIAHGFTALGAANPWYADIGEFSPYLFAGQEPWPDELVRFLRVFSLTPLLVPVAAVLLHRAWREKPEERLPLGFFAVFSSVFIALALARRRFDVYAAVPLALCGAWAVRHVADRLSGRLGGRAPVRWVMAFGMMAAMVSTTLLPLLRGEGGEHPPGPEKIPLLAWLRNVPGTPDGSEAVLSQWSLGHEIQWFARKPVVSTPFGTDIGARSMRDEAAFFLADRPDAAEEVLRRRRVGFVFLRNPIPEIAIMEGFVPGQPVRVIRRATPSTGVGYDLYAEALDLVPSRLYFLDGGSLAGQVAALGNYRLLAESPETVEVMQFRASAYKLFGVVAGAALRIRGATPGSAVSATLPVRTDAGRAFLWRTQAVAGPSGSVELRVPYASGWNGKVQAGRCAVGDGKKGTEVAVSESQVVRGETIPVDLLRRRHP